MVLFDETGINKLDEILVYLILDYDDPHYKFKIQAIVQNPRRDEKIYRLQKNIETTSFLDFIEQCRFIVFECSNFDNCQSQINKINFGKPVSLENEINAWHLIQEQTQNYLNRYPTTLREDNEILKRNDKLNFLTYN